MKEPQRKNTEIGNMSPGVKAKTEEVEKGKMEQIIIVIKTDQDLQRRQKILT